MQIRIKFNISAEKFGNTAYFFSNEFWFFFVQVVGFGVGVRYLIYHILEIHSRKKFDVSI